MKHVCRAVVVFSAVFTGACSTAANSGAGGGLETPERFTTFFRGDAVPHRTVVQAPIDVVWRALPQVYREFGYPGATASNTEERIFLTPHMQIRGRLYEGEANSKYIDCGIGMTGPRADTHDVHFAIVTRVRASSETETLVETLIDGTARDRSATGGSTLCKGTGLLEQAVVEALIARLGK